MCDGLELPCTTLIKGCDSKEEAYQRFLDEIKHLEFSILEVAKQGCYIFAVVDEQPQKEIPKSILVSTIYKDGNSRNWWVSSALETDIEYLKQNYHLKTQNVTLYKCPKRLLYQSENMTQQALLWRTMSQTNEYR